MKKIFVALVVTVLSLTAFAKANVQAADLSTGYTWVDNYANVDGKTLMLPHGGAWSNFHYGYSGVDVILGNYVVSIAAGNMYVPSTDMAAPAALNYSSLAAVYDNTSADQTWYISKNNLTSYFLVFMDQNGQVYDILNSHVHFVDANNADTFQADTFYNVSWNSTTNQMDSTGLTTDVTPKYDESYQLTYADLDTNYHWLTQATVDAKTATGVTFAATDLLYVDADGNYTNVPDGNTAVMNDFNGYTIPAGCSMLAIEYLDYVDYTPNIQNFWTLVNGQDNVASIVEHDVVAPTITGAKTGPITVQPGDTLDVTTGITATDNGLLTQTGDETTPTVNVAYNEWDVTTQAFDTPVASMDFQLPGQKFQVVYTATDTNNNTATKKVEVDVIGAQPPVITGTQNVVVNQGQAVDLTTGVTVDDGYGNNITDQLTIFSGNLDVNNPQPGVYEVMYYSTNALFASSTKVITVTVLDTEKPVVFAPTSPVVITKGTDFDLTSVVFGYDNASSVTTTVIDNDFYDKDTTGTYSIQVQVADDAGNKTKVTYTLEVVDKDNTALIGDLTSGQSDLTDGQQALSSSLDSKTADLQAQLDTLTADQKTLKTDTGSKDQTDLILTIVVGVVALAGVGVAGFTLKKK